MAKKHDYYNQREDERPTMLSLKRRNAKGRERNRPSRRQEHFSSTRPSYRNRTIDLARQTAFNALREVNGEGAYGNLALPTKIRTARLQKRDAALATELVYGTLRWQGSYDAIIAACLDRPLSEIEAPILDMLRLGSHQLLNTRIAAHAAVDQSVSMSRAMIGAGPAQLVNAVLRKISTYSLGDWFFVLEEERKIKDKAEKLGLEKAHPSWIVRAFEQALIVHGRQNSELEALLEANNQSPAVNLVALDRVGSAEEIIAAGARPSALISAGFIYSNGDLGRFPEIRKGTVRVQDIGSQLVTRAFAAAPVHSSAPGKPEAWADLCAGPGGKAALLTALAQPGGHIVYANEVSAHRARLVRQALAVFPESSWRINVDDSCEIGARKPSYFDRILIDAPCSGLGALRRRPEARWRRSPGDIPKLALLQQKLLNSAIAALKPGGVIGFVVCSPHIAETVLVVSDVLKKHDCLTLVNASRMLGQAAIVPNVFVGTAGTFPKDSERMTYIRQNTAQLWPHIHGTDAMFLALLQKRISRATDRNKNHE